jgi:hypothetical protein
MALSSYKCVMDDLTSTDPTDRRPSFNDLDEEAVLRRILEGTATDTGERFFQSLVRNLAEALHTHAAWVTEYVPEKRSLRALAFWLDGQWVQDYERVIDGSPCEVVIAEDRLVHYPDRIVAPSGSPSAARSGTCKTRWAGPCCTGSLHSAGSWSWCRRS